MGSELPCQSYVTCPKCSTLFKPKKYDGKLNKYVACICCGYKYKLEPTQSHFDQLINKKPINITVEKLHHSAQNQESKSIKNKANSPPPRLSLKPYFLFFTNFIKSLNSLIYQQVCRVNHLIFKLNKFLSDLLFNSVISCINISKKTLTNLIVNPLIFFTIKPYKLCNKLITETYNSYKINKKISNQNNASNSISRTDKLLLAHNLKSKLVFLSSIFMPLFVVSLLSSSVYIYKDKLAQNDNWRPFIEQFCYLVNCNINTYSDLKYLVIEDNAMVTIPNSSNKIQVFAMISNIGKYDQRYPDLKIKFTDLNENLILEKIIPPEEYLTNNSKDRNKLITKNSKQYVDVLIDDPGPAAVSYEIALQ